MAFSSGKKVVRSKAALLAMLGFVAASWLCWTAPARASESGQSPDAQSLNWPLPPTGEELKEKPDHCLIYQTDAQPLGDRKPLLLIHGGGSEHKELCHWEKMVTRFNEDERFRHQFKVYLMRYDSTRLLEDIMPEAKTQLIKLAESCRKPLTIMALSMGGNVAQLAAEDKEADQVIERVIAMGSPFHGSPLFSSDWFQYSLYKSKFLPVFRLLDSIDYRVYFAWHKNYQQDLKWDDSDDLVPQVGAFKSKIPLGPKGVLTVGRDTSSILSEANLEHKVDKKKFTAYAGYLLNTYVLSKERDRLRYRIMAPFHFLSTQLRAQIGEENAALLVLNREISKIDTGPGGAELGQGEHVYALNDGITPVSSALYLPENICRTHLLLRETDLQGIAQFIDVASARAFRNIDHVTFVDGKPPHHGKLVRDSLHPEQGMHEIFDWMLAEVLKCKVEEVERVSDEKPGRAGV